MTKKKLKIGIVGCGAIGTSLAKLLDKKFKKENDVPYNFYIYHGSDWYLRIIPRLIHRAGFELGTGLSVNIVDPTNAAKEYKEGF